jgi:RNA polymerase sigma-70 factor, ECF subfamily
MEPRYGVREGICPDCPGLRTASRRSARRESARWRAPKLRSIETTPAGWGRGVPSDNRERPLVERLVAGDEEALRDVYRRHSPAVFGLAMRVLANETLAEDVTQDVFVRLWQQPERFDPDRGQLRAYLLAMAHSRAVERVRSEESLRRRHRTVADEPVFNTAPDPERLVLEADAGAAVRKALSELPMLQRVPIELAYFEGLSYRQVATRLAEPEGTVKYRIRCGMQKLRAALREVELQP